ncbi:hypothetical protein KSS87_023489, partial [Heliosperma pusillum]
MHSPIFFRFPLNNRTSANILSYPYSFLAFTSGKPEQSAT